MKVGLLLDSTTVSRGFATVIRDVQRSDFASIDIVVEVGRRRFEQRHSILFDLYLRWDARYNGPDPLSPHIDATALLQNVERIQVGLDGVQPPLVLPSAVIQQLRERQLDVLLCSGGPFGGDVLDAARYGVWRFQYGDEQDDRGGPDLFWEVWEARPLSTVTLEVLTPDANRRIALCRSILPTKLSLSIADSHQGPCDATSHFVVRILNELHSAGWAAVQARAVPDTARTDHRRLYQTPTNAEVARWAVRRVANRVGRALQPARMNHWQIAVRRGGPFLSEAAAAERALDPIGFKWLKSPKGRFFADPFLFERDGHVWLFAEEFDYAQNRGWISVAELSPRNEPPVFETCLDLPHHLSFPFVFEHDQEMWLVPESAAAGNVTLYKAKRFPLEWSAERVLLEGEYVDTVLWREGETWWMLTTPRQPSQCSVHSLLFHSTDLLGKWQLHPASPLFNDVRFARNGGAVFHQDGRRFRVSQDCSIEYGRAFQFNEITTLDKLSYVERPVGRLEPTFLPNLVGIHTYTRAGDWEAIDGCFRVPRREVCC